MWRALVAVDQVHRLVAHRVGDVVVDRAQQRDVEQQLAARDVRVRDLGRRLPHRVQEVRPELRERRALDVRAVVVDVVVAREPARDVAVALLVGDKRREDLRERRVARALCVRPLDLEQRAGEQLDAGHVREVLDDRLLLVPRQARGRARPIDVVRRPLVANAALEHAREIHEEIIVRTVTASAFEKLDEKAFSRFHVLAMFTTGMGVFTDGYDLSSIGLVLPLCLASFGVDEISSVQSGLLTGSALVGSVIGALLFGWLAQKGRKRFYGIDVGIMAAAAAVQAFAPNLWALIAIRFVLGIGVGADYVLSPTIMAEHSNRKDRGKKLGFGFGAMWGFGAIVASLVLLLLQHLGVDRGPAVADRARLRRGAGAVGADAAPQDAGVGALPRARRGRHREGQGGDRGDQRRARHVDAGGRPARLARAVREARPRGVRRGAAVDGLRHRPVQRRAVRPVGDRRRHGHDRGQLHAARVRGAADAGHAARVPARRPRSAGAA